MSCTTCHRRHYAPSGARCPYHLGQAIPPEQQPENDADGQNLDLSDSDILSEEEQDGQRSPTPHYSASEFELPSAQPEPQPSTSTEQVASPVNTQNSTETTDTRVQQLEAERTRMAQTQQTLLTQQRTLEAQLDAIKQQWLPQLVQPLQPNQDVRQRTHQHRLYPAIVSQPGSAAQSRASTPTFTQQPEATGNGFYTHREAANQTPHPAVAQHTDQFGRPLFFRSQPTLAPPGAITLQPQISAFTPITRLDIDPTYVAQPAPQPPQQCRPTTTYVPVPQPQTLQPQWPQQNQQAGAAPTTLTELRTDTALMDRAAQVVSSNTQDTTDQSKHPKSGLKRDNTEQVCRVIPWPHEYVTHHTGKAPTYDSLTLSEFAAGNMRIFTQIPGIPPLLYHMASYMSELYDDISDTEWPSVRFAHRVVLQALENGLTDYQALADLRQMRSIAITRATRRNTTPTAGSASAPYKPRQWSNNQNQQVKRPCLPYQKGECGQTRNHQSGQGYVLHACAFCLSSVGRPYGHPESECRRKLQTSKEAKNDESPQENK